MFEVRRKSSGLGSALVAVILLSAFLLMVPLKSNAGTKKKGASPQQYVEGLNGETACHSRVSTLAAETS